MINLGEHIRQEILNLPVRKKEISSEIFGLSLSGASLNPLDGTLYVEFEHPEAAERLQKLLTVDGWNSEKQVFEVERFGGRLVYAVTYSYSPVVQVLLQHERLEDADIVPKVFVRGLLLARGGLYLPASGGYRLVFSSKYDFVIEYLADILSEWHVSFAKHYRMHRDAWFMHIMNYDDILTILNRLKLYQTIKVLSVHRKEKSARELAIRLTNSELANLKRRLRAAMRQARKFELLNEADIPPELIPLWRIRMSEEGMQMSYSELAETLGWSKSKVMRGLKRLENIADKKGGKKDD